MAPPDFRCRASRRSGSGRRRVQWLSSIFWLGVAAAIATVLWRWGAEAGRQESGDRAADEATALPAPTHRRAAAAGACAVIVGGALLLLVHHATVPLTTLHEPWRFASIGYWKPQSPPTRAWATDGGIWTGGHDDVALLLSSRAPLELVVLELTSLAPMQADVQVGGARESVRLAPGERAFARLNPGPATRWGDEYFYHLNVVARGGVSRAALGIDDDGRGLGVRVRVFDLEASSP